MCIFQKEIRVFFRFSKEPLDPKKLSKNHWSRVWAKIDWEVQGFLSSDKRLFPGGSDSKESACHAEDPGLIPGSGRSPGEGQGNPLQHFCLENAMDRGAWWATVHGLTESDTT